MKNVLIFSCGNDINAIDLAFENIDAGNNILFLQCDKFLGICQHNRYGSPFMCYHCKKSMIRWIKNFASSEKCRVKYLTELVKKDDVKKANDYIFDFDTVQTLKDLKYNGMSVGYGAFSSYVTFSRNVMPDFTNEFKEYISFLIRKEIAIINLLERLQLDYKFDEFVFHNGRFAQFKPFLEFAKINNIKFVCTEHIIHNNRYLKDNYYNNIPHSIDCRALNVLENWDKGDSKDREAIGRSFFEKRKKGIPAGDKVFIKQQHSGEMPNDWDPSVENITIFNSSEDEFLAVSKEYDSYLMFPNQYTALKTIFDHYKGDKTKHFYLRIHPNLKDVPFKSHLALYKLNYDNVTIIPAGSSISSYSLLDSSDKIIIFDSTMGIEAAYWEKPVIALSKYTYLKLGLLNYPNTVDELWTCIDNKNLPINANDNLIKFGYWFMHPNKPEVKRVPYKVVSFSILNKHFLDYTIMTFCGSHKMHVFLEYLLNKFPLFSKFRKLPCTEPYKD